MRRVPRGSRHVAGGTGRIPGKNAAAGGHPVCPASVPRSGRHPMNTHTPASLALTILPVWLAAPGAAQSAGTLAPPTLRRRLRPAHRHDRGELGGAGQRRDRDDRSRGRGPARLPGLVSQRSGLLHRIDLQPELGVLGGVGPLSGESSRKAHSAGGRSGRGRPSVVAPRRASGRSRSRGASQGSERAAGPALRVPIAAPRPARPGPPPASTSRRTACATRRSSARSSRPRAIRPRAGPSS